LAGGSRASENILPARRLSRKITRAMSARPGPRNLITDVAGIAVGNAADESLNSGVTVVLPASPVVASVDVRGGAPGTRETDLLDPAARVDRVDAIVLSGGSAFGLDAAAGVMGWLAERGRGVAVGDAIVPIVPAAILFDLRDGIARRWGDMPPYRALARRAVEGAADDFALGNHGAGLGAKAGRLKGGLGSASIVDPAGGATVGALVAANPWGSVVMPGSPCLWAWALEQDDELGGQPRPDMRALDLADLSDCASVSVSANTTIAVVATDATLTKSDCRRLAMMAQAGLARAIRPIHTLFDGDTVFALATARRGPLDPVGLVRLGALAADCLARAVARAVFEAHSTAGFVSYRERYGQFLKKQSW
jgi:L-aminopeptidase/D-esterase-like protein